MSCLTTYIRNLMSDHFPYRTSLIGSHIECRPLIGQELLFVGSARLESDLHIMVHEFYDHVLPHEEPDHWLIVFIEHF